jgi:hypothetical protein
MTMHTDLHNLHFAFAQALGFSVFTDRLLATDLKTESSISNHYEVFLSFLLQSPRDLRTQIKTLLECPLGYPGTSSNPLARTPQKTRVICQT